MLTALVKIRPVGRQHAQSIALLAGQLGYPSTAAQILERLEWIQRDEGHAVFVAEPAAGLAVGWVHVFVCHLVESDTSAEIGGLVVDQRHRDAGFGRLLLEQAEAWARTHGCGSIRLRSNVIRKEAHAFYLKRGYTLLKTQHAFVKAL
jgi:GNAT superfamily N-acetyltransferase